jgi:hypothetical protein
VNRTLAKVALAAVAPLILVSAISLTSGVASAKKAPVATISCKTLLATISWNPPLVSGTATSKTTQITIANASVSGCTTSPTSSVTSGAVAATASKSVNGNSCSSLTATGGKPTKYTFVITWNGGGGTSTVKFAGSTTNASPPSFELSNGKGSGAFKTKTAQAIADPNAAGAAAVSKCVTGAGGTVSSVTITGGSVSL